MQIQITYATLYDVVERSLSIIGKRSVDDNGNLLFKDITLGTREQEIAYDYFRAAIVHVAAELREYVTGETRATDSYTLTLTLDADANSHLEDTIRQAVNDYAVAYALYSWFTVTAPRIHDKYLAEAKDAMVYLTYQVKHRQRPSSLPNPLRERVDPSDT